MYPQAPLKTSCVQNKFCSTCPFLALSNHLTLSEKTQYSKPHYSTIGVEIKLVIEQKNYQTCSPQCSPHATPNGPEIGFGQGSCNSESWILSWIPPLFSPLLSPSQPASALPSHHKFWPLTPAAPVPLPSLACGDIYPWPHQCRPVNVCANVLLAEAKPWQIKTPTVLWQKYLLSSESSEWADIDAICFRIG